MKDSNNENVYTPIRIFEWGDASKMVQRKNPEFLRYSSHDESEQSYELTCKYNSFKLYIWWSNNSHLFEKSWFQLS